MRYGVDPYIIDTALREVRCGEQPVAVEPQVFDLLLYLIEHRERVVGKDELIERIWQGRAISDAALSSCVKAARRTVGDDGQQQRLIRTLHRRGFRFIGPVEPQICAAAAIAAVDTDGFGNAEPAPEAAAPEEGQAVDLDLTLPSHPSIAILPIRPAGGEEQELLADGLTHDITVRLARTRWLFVTARASAARFRAPDTDPTEIARQLGVRYLLRGSLLVLDDRLRLTAIVTDAVQGCEIWAERFDRRLDDLFAVQDEICDLIVAAVESEIEQKERQRALLRPFATLDAWGAFHRACHYLYRYLPEHHEEAERYLKLAASLDPNASRVFAALSFVHWQRAFLEMTSDRSAERAKAFDYARHSLSLDPRDPQAHWALGRAFLLEGEVEQAREELLTAVELNPNFAIGQYSLAFGLSFSGGGPHGFEGVGKARRLSPYDPMTFAFMALRGTLHAFSGEPEAAADWTARALRQPNGHYHLLAIAAWCHQLAGRRQQAGDYLGQLWAVRPGYSREDYFRAFPFAPRERAVIERAFAGLGL